MKRLTPLLLAVLPLLGMTALASACPDHSSHEEAQIPPPPGGTSS